MIKYRIIETPSGFNPQFKRIHMPGEDSGEMWCSIYPYRVETLEEAQKLIAESKLRDEQNRIIKIHEG